MKKYTLFCLIITLFSINQVYSDWCNCGPNADYNPNANKCVKLPSEDSELIEGCQSYKFNQDYTKFICRFCKPSYLLKQGECIKTDQEHCTYFVEQLNQDKLQDQQLVQRVLDDQQYNCLSCTKGYYSNVEEKCVPEPIEGQQGYIENCARYDYAYGKLQCQFCLDNHYWYDNKCFENPNNVENCSYYHFDKDSNSTYCSSCQDNYILTENICVEQPKDSQCNQYNYNKQTKKIVCEWCDGESLVQDVSNPEKCINIADEISLCKNGYYSKESKKYICEWCQLGYYVKNNECVKNPKKGDKQYRDNCQIYKLNYDKSQLKCERCYSPYAANYLSGSCVKGQEVENCVRYYYSNKPSCFTCKKGYITGINDQSNTCIKCPTQIEINTQNTQAQIVIFSMAMAFVILGTFI